eukprot:GEZU01010440.1.p1 GENE.GEZU01010440.1~~GEZU01010440.1.p1  ORF type:complete len:453 (-),score=69.26 GEZU01010440.1:168-1442(-)
MVSNSSAAHVSTKREDCRHIHQHTPTTDSEEEPPLKLIFISDIHVCVNDPISWYQSKIHEASVCAILDYATCEKQPAFDIVFLGDFVDTWTARVAIAPEELPSWARIRNANTFLFDKIAEAMDLIKGEMYFVNGNHDMHITREDIEGVVSSSGKKHMVFLESGEYTHSNGLIRATHGHVFSLLNSYDKTSPFNGIPVGYFITRLWAEYDARALKDGQTVADFVSNGSPFAPMVAKKVYEEVKDSTLSRSKEATTLIYEKHLTEVPGVVGRTITDGWLRYFLYCVGIDSDYNIKDHDLVFTMPPEAGEKRNPTFAEVKKIYAAVWDNYATAQSKYPKACEALGGKQNRHDFWACQALKADGSDDFQYGAELLWHEGAKVQPALPLSLSLSFCSLYSLSVLISHRMTLSCFIELRRWLLWDTPMFR